MTVRLSSGSERYEADVARRVPGVADRAARARSVGSPVRRSPTGGVVWVGIRGGDVSMVPTLEIAFLVLCVALGVRWFRRTNIYRAHRRSGVSPGQFGVGRSGGFGILGGSVGL